MEEKKVYEAPRVKKVTLEIKESVLTTCNTSHDNGLGEACDFSPGTCFI